jgi:hypothetical protein
MNRLMEVLLSSAALVGLATSAQADPQATWRAAISNTALPGAGCYAAHYPSLTWKHVPCATAPNVPLIPASGSGGGGETVGNGHDYQAVVSPAIISTGTGSFPIARVKSETGDGESNAYTIQLNSNFMSGSPACDGAKNPPDCLDWEQFVYFAEPYNEVFIQYWLINYDTTCPTGWSSDGGDCYTNSNATNVPVQVIKNLKYLTLTGSAVAGGDDTLKFMTQNDAYSVTNNDDMVYLADYWQGIEFNVVGPGGGSEAVFNTGTKITVGIAETDGTSTAPDCVANDGTTGETNNLNLVGKCTATGGSTPSVSFKETLAK